MLKMIGAPKLVEIRRIHIDGSASVDMEKENVRDIERSIVENGNTVINPSWVDKKTSRIVQGRDRILAQMRFRKCALVQYVSGTEEEYARIQIEENLCRRHDNKDALRSKLVELLAPSLAHEAITGRNLPLITQEVQPKKGRPSEGKAAAIAEIAKKEGVSPRTVRASISRAKKKEAAPIVEDDDSGETPEPIARAARVSCLRTLGLEIPDAIEANARDEQKRVDRMAKALAEFGAALTDHRKEQAGLSAAEDKLFEEWEAQRSAMASAIRRSRPACVCPHCKMLLELMMTCPACRGTGYVSEEKLENVEAALLAEGDDSGVWVPAVGKRPQWRTMIAMRGEDF
jgi:hypothetical protein